MVHFSPESSTLHTLSLTCRTSLNQSYTLKVLGQGISPLVTLSHTRLALPPTPEGDTTACDVTLTNESRTNQSFEMKPPEGSCLKVSPAVGTLRPEESLRVLIEFTAPVNPDPVEYTGPGSPSFRGALVPAEEQNDVRRLAVWGMTLMMAFLSAPVALLMAVVNLVRGEDLRINTHVLTITTLIFLAVPAGALELIAAQLAY